MTIRYIRALTNKTQPEIDLLKKMKLKQSQNSKRRAFETDGNENITTTKIQKPAITNFGEFHRSAHHLNYNRCNNQNTLTGLCHVF